jgi:translation initiation factor 1 (eIF-1/SUI1)
MDCCKKCSLPLDLCLCSNKREINKITIKERKLKKFKYITIIDGLYNKKTLLPEFKKKFGCGGTIKNGNLILQGNHALKVKDHLLKIGINEKMISIII